MNIQQINETFKLKTGGEGHILFIAQSGASKTLALERFVEEHHKKDYVIVYIENAKANLESGFCAFEPKVKYHLDALKFQGEKPSKKDIKLYHLNYNIPTFKKIPETQLWTMNIKRFDRLLTSYLFENTSETSSISILNTAIDRLKKSEGFFDLILNIKKSGLKRKKDLFDMESSASSININTILNFLGRFKDLPIIMPENYEHNLDVAKLLNDSKPIHIFSNRYISDIKVRDLSTLYILNEIRRAKASGKIKKEVMVVIDEIKTLSPQNPLHDFQKILSKLLAELLSVCRSLGIRVLSASQLYNEIDSAVRQSFSHVILGKTTALQDLYFISNVAGLDVEDRQWIMELGYNEFYFLSQDIAKKGTWRFHLPTHAHAERNQVFDRMFEKEYPEKMMNHKEVTKKIANDFQNQKIRAMESLNTSENSKGVDAH